MACQTMLDTGRDTCVCSRGSHVPWLSCSLSCFLRRVPGDFKEDHHPVTQDQMREFAALQDERLHRVEMALDTKKDKRKGELVFSFFFFVRLLAFNG